MLRGEGTVTGCFPNPGARPVRVFSDLRRVSNGRVLRAKVFAAWLLSACPHVHGRRGVETEFVRHSGGTICRSAGAAAARTVSSVAADDPEPPTGCGRPRDNSGPARRNRRLFYAIGSFCGSDCCLGGSPDLLKPYKLFKSY